MGKVSEVEIPDGSGNHYRYEYDESSGKTLYKGPVGGAPALSEEEFLMVTNSHGNQEWLDIASDLGSRDVQFEDGSHGWGYWKSVHIKDLEQVQEDGMKWWKLANIRFKENNKIYEDITVLREVKIKTSGYWKDEGKGKPGLEIEYRHSDEKWNSKGRKITIPYDEFKHWKNQHDIESSMR